ASSLALLMRRPDDKRWIVVFSALSVNPWFRCAVSELMLVLMIDAISKLMRRKNAQMLALLAGLLRISCLSCRMERAGFSRTLWASYRQRVLKLEPPPAAVWRDRCVETAFPNRQKETRLKREKSPGNQGFSED